MTSIILRVKDLGFLEMPSTEQLYEKALKEWGLELHHPEQGPRDALRKVGHPSINPYSIGMESIAGPLGYPRVFGVGPYGREVGLYGSWARPGFRWDLEEQFSFCVPS